MIVTPNSGTRGWGVTWSEKGQLRWLKRKRDKKEWLDVRLINGSKLVSWIHRLPLVEKWLANKFGIPGVGLESLEERWEVLEGIGSPPPLPATLFKANRENAIKAVREVFSGKRPTLQLDTHFVGDVAEFVASLLEENDEEEKLELYGKCIIVSDAVSWSTLCISLDEPHVLIANFDIEDEAFSKDRLLEKAQNYGHQVIFKGRPGGIPHNNRVQLQNPTVTQIRETLEKGEYPEARARELAIKSGGNLSLLLRLIRDLSYTPEWTQRTDAAELVIAQLLGAWDGASEGDRAVVENLSGKTYGEWIEVINNIVLQTSAPLKSYDSKWKIVGRWELWCHLSPKLTIEILNKFEEMARTVLSERDPQFDLPTSEHYMSRAQGYVPIHTDRLQSGIAETLALLGTKPEFVSGITQDQVLGISYRVVREVLGSGNHEIWASIGDNLPMLAEASPEAFLEAVEQKLNNNPDHFKKLIMLESSGVFGRTYISGLLWALETLAWDPKYLTRVIIVLGGLSSVDPGGSWSNRPMESLRTILLPWYPQTCADLDQRRISLQSLTLDYPDQAWEIILSLLPASGATSSGSRKPAWRDFIPGSWRQQVTHNDYQLQIEEYSRKAFELAGSNLDRLITLVDKFRDLSHDTQDELIRYLGSHGVTSQSDPDRFGLWNELVKLITKHRRYHDAEGAGVCANSHR